MNNKTGAMIKDAIFLVLASALGSFATTAIMIPNGLTCGGLTGIVRILQCYINADFALLYYAGTIIVLGIVALTMGLKEARKVIIITMLYPTILAIFERADFKLIDRTDLMLGAVFCGFFLGLCNGIVFWRGYAFCGTESIAKIINRKILPHIHIGNILLCLDTSIIAVSALVFSRDIALYALITQFIAARMVNLVMYGCEAQVVQLGILTSEPDAVKNYIMTNLGRGISGRYIIGEYTQVIRKELVVLCSPRESILIKEFLVSKDPNAFVTILHVNAV